jgi:integrase
MEELAMEWLLVFPWRQRNLRECRVDGDNPNLFKSKIPEFSAIQKPEWVLKEEARNPDAEFWQVKFSREETKTGVTLHVIVPQRLVGLLEEYLTIHRPVLLKSALYEPLIVTEEKGEADTRLIGNIVSDRTLRHGGRRVTPHLFRDIVAFAWLKAHPKDYLTLSKMLWHKNISTTINYYGSRFNESSGVCAMEEWLEERASKARGNL